MIAELRQMAARVIELLTEIRDLLRRLEEANRGGR